MPRTYAKVTIAAALVLALAACGDPTKEDIVEDARGIESRAQLTDKLGDPDNIEKLGPIEHWTYQASNGKVTFIITGERVALQAASGN